MNLTEIDTFNFFYLHLIQLQTPNFQFLQSKCSSKIKKIRCTPCCCCYYYMDESVLLGTKPLVDSIRHFIRDRARRYEFYVLVTRTISHSIASLTREILFLPLEHKIHIFSPPCNILYFCYGATYQANS